MSKVKSPGKKKALSLELDRRNTYGDNSKSSRKNIARGKQRAHMKERRLVDQVLRDAGPAPTEDEATAAELAAKVAAGIVKLKGFKKSPDTPLGEFLAQKR